MAAYVTPEALADLLAVRSGLLFILDYDGVLVEIAPAPDLAVPGARVLALLFRLARREDTTVAVVSGRAPDDLARLLPVPGLVLVGCHGAAVVEGGRTTWLIEQPVPGLAAFAALARRLTAGCPGFLVEEKGAAVAVHYRLVPAGEADAVLRELVAGAAPLLKDGGLKLLPGHQVLEVRHPRAAKDAAAVRLMARFPRWPVCFGDDTTDEDTFRAVAGRGTSVLVAGADRPTLAGYRFSSPRAVHAFLELMVQRPRHVAV